MPPRDSATVVWDPIANGILIMFGKKGFTPHRVPAMYFNSGHPRIGSSHNAANDGYAPFASNTFCETRLVAAGSTTRLLTLGNGSVSARANAISTASVTHVLLLVCRWR